MSLVINEFMIDILMELIRRFRYPKKATEAARYTSILCICFESKGKKISMASECAVICVSAQVVGFYRS